MPTGYTDKIKDGITFEQFAMNCARAFGACIEMRDDPADKEIPDEFKPSDYHIKQIEEAKKNIKLLKNMSQKEKSEAAEKEYLDNVAYHEKSRQENIDLLEKYNSMLKCVKSWEPPTSEHIRFKEFMIEQIEGSIKFDIHPEYYEKYAPKPLSSDEWYNKKLEEANDNLKYHKKEYAEEVERCKGRSKWIKDLKVSLKK